MYPLQLLTHNLLQCNIKGVKNGYPLRIEVVEKKCVSEVNPS